jgi:hypothetical protein
MKDAQKGENEREGELIYLMSQKKISQARDVIINNLMKWIIFINV